MLTQVDWTKEGEVRKSLNNHPNGALLNADYNDFRIMAQLASEEAYAELTKKLEGQKKLRELLFVYSHLVFVHYQFDDLTISDIEIAHEEILGLFQPARSPKDRNAKPGSAKKVKTNSKNRQKTPRKKTGKQS